MPKTLVTIGTYNEKENLANLVAAILNLDEEIDVLVVDDNSPDGTGAIADELAAEHPEVHVMHREGKLGLGTAHIAGMRFSIEKDYAHVLTMDADFSHHPKYLPDLIHGMETHDLVMGSRYIEGGGVVGWGLKRKLMSWCANFLTRTVLRLKARDCSGGFKCYKVETLKKLDLDDIFSVGYSFQEEMVYRCQKAGFSIGESPIVFEDRTAGTSKATFREVLGVLGMTFGLRLKRKHVLKDNES